MQEFWIVGSGDWQFEGGGGEETGFRNEINICDTIYVLRKS